MPLLFITPNQAIQTSQITKAERQSANADLFDLTLGSGPGPPIVVDKVQMSAIFKAEGQQPATEI